ncbi:MAG: MAC/perforin domain-containing protein, partial [Chitinophagales bacterium]
MQTLTLNIGDVVTVSVKGKPDLTWYQIYITERTPKINPIIINPEVIWFANDSRAIGTPILNYYFNTKGIHIHNYTPRIITQSFNSANIFEGISKESLDYQISDDGQYIYTEGFKYVPLHRSQENQESTFTKNKNDYKKSVNVNIGATFPLDPKMKTQGRFDFGYKKDNEQRVSSDSYNWYESKKVFSYQIHIEDYGRLRMDPNFLDYLDGMEAGRYTAKDFVAKYGTHYPESIEYGGQYSKNVSIEKDDYFQSEKEDWNIGIGASISKSGTKTISQTEGGLTVKGDNKSSQVASVDLDFGETEEQAERNLLQKTKRQALYIGGSGIGDDWSVGPNDATPVKLKTNQIDALFFPHKHKNKWTENICGKWRNAVRA